ncbi:helix-turn-helix transcriptional regulator [Actinocorallia sp. B10E7]|uniref:helix-turn-helix domain-containing protein n=1 Tax=Actinocorallia sp. B10E7 TaxID=3153558 RepID=UPI00325FB4E4
MPPRSSPTARRRRLANALRQLREEHGLSCAELGRRLGWSEAKVSRIETARVGVKADDLDRLLEHFQVPEDLKEKLMLLRKQAGHRGWWHSYTDAFPLWFHNYVGLEDGARSLITYQNQLIHGLLQTDDYANAVIRAHQPAIGPEEIDRQLTARATRRATLTRTDPLIYWAILDEAVLHRVVGSADIMRAQLTHLRQMAALPNVTLQVLPFNAGAHASMGTSFNIMKFPDAGDPDIVYIEDLTTSQYLEEPHDIERYTVVIDHLRASALSPEASDSLIARFADDMT